MDVDYRDVRLNFDDEVPKSERPKIDISKLPAMTQLLPTGDQIYKVVKYLNLTANIEIVLVIIRCSIIIV
jgi:hypothetical protein